MSVRLFASTLCALLALWVPPLQALAQDCPPVAAPPTPDQLQQGQAKAEPERFRVVDASKSPEAVHEHIRSLLPA